MSKRPDALVAGGGVAGAACAAWLARAGLRVVLLEREAATPHKVCGEFLSVEALHYLRLLGVEPEALGAVAIEKVRLAAGGGIAERRLPFTAMSLSRRTLDEALLHRADAEGVEIRRGAPVRSLNERHGVWRASIGNGDAVEAEAAFLATGKHDLRGWRRPAGRQPELIGLKMHWRLAGEQAAALAGCVELILFEGGYAGLEPVEGGQANLCLLVHRDRFAAFDRRWDRLIDALREASPLLDARLGGATSCWDVPLAVGRIPFGYVRCGGTGPWRIGDQAAVTPSFTGDGMALALHSACMAAVRHAAGDSVQDFHRALAHDMAGPVRRGMWLSQVLVRASMQTAIAKAARLAPWLTTWCIVATRLPGKALLRPDH